MEEAGAEDEVEVAEVVEEEEVVVEAEEGKINPRSMSDLGFFC